MQFPSAGSDISLLAKWNPITYNVKYGNIVLNETACVYDKIWMHTYFVKFEQLIRQNNVPERRVDCGFDSRQRHKIWVSNSVGLECNPYKVEVVGSNPTGTTDH